jgi:LemA protein
MLVIIALTALALCAAAAMAFISAGNRLAALDARCRTAFADIDVHLRRRADLIPDLVECVKGFAAHEAQILGELPEVARSSLTTVPDARNQAEAALGRKVGLMLNFATKYPDLAASAHFRELRGELTGTQERIAAARRFFNLAVEEYNATRNQFPASIAASARHFGERKPFDLGVERVALEEAVPVRFSAQKAT